jgi:hypothetical protein
MTVSGPSMDLALIVLPFNRGNDRLRLDLFSTSGVAATETSSDPATINPMLAPMFILPVVPQSKPAEASRATSRKLLRSGS